MLALTPNAAEVVDSLVSSEDLPETAGLRITSEESLGGPEGNQIQRDLRLSVVEQPEAGDELVEGTQIFLEPGETAELLDDKVLDADVQGTEVRFSLMAQGGPEPG
jgi:iron-sulfur cluster assembly protein